MGHRSGGGGGGVVGGDMPLPFPDEAWKLLVAMFVKNTISRQTKGAGFGGVGWGGHCLLAISLALVALVTTHDFDMQ